MNSWKRLTKALMVSLAVAMVALLAWLVMRPFGSRVATQVSPSPAVVAGTPSAATAPAGEPSSIPATAMPPAELPTAAAGTAAAAPVAHCPRPRPEDPLLARSETLSTRESPAAAESGHSDNEFVRVRLIKAPEKYPLLRVEERLVRDAATGQETLLCRTIAVADHVMVKVLPGVGQNELEALSQKHGATIRRKMYSPDTYLVAFPNPDIDTLPKAVAALSAEQKDIEIAEPDYMAFPLKTPNDPFFGRLWGMHNTGQRVNGQLGIFDKDIDAPAAWDLGSGTVDVVVGVIDTGVDYRHPDLATNMWQNPGEIAGNGIDDDNNGFIDDLYGWDFYDWDADPMDEHSHGTHVAGTIGAVGNNARGVAGVCWRVKMMALRGLGPFGGFDSDLIDAIRYATQMAVRLTNNSWGGYGGNLNLWMAIEEAGASNILFVAAAANDDNDNDGLFPAYPASYPSLNIIAVAATDNRDDRACFSNYGKTSVDLGAPGVDIYSCTPSNTYQYFSGTSMASPMVAGACALYWSINTNATALEVKDAILNSVDPSETLKNRTVTGGRLNIANALALQSLLITNTLEVGSNSVFVTGGNGDGYVDPNECNQLWVLVKNAGTKPISNLVATLVSETENLFVTQPTSAYPAVIAPGATATNNVAFQIHTRPDFDDFSHPLMRLVTTAKGQAKENLYFYPPSRKYARYDNNTPLELLDWGTVESPIVVSNFTTEVRKVTVSMFIEHTWDADLHIYLVGPDNTTVPLTRNNGSSGDNYGTSCVEQAKTTFDDEATNSIMNGTAPFVGTFAPEKPLALFTGKPPSTLNGTWKLRIADLAPGDTGTNHCWSLFLHPAGSGACAKYAPKTQLADFTAYWVALYRIANTSTVVGKIAIQNKGPGSAGQATHRIYFEGYPCDKMIKEVTFPSHGAGAWKFIEFKADVGHDPQYYRLTAVLDVKNEVDETDEDNNDARSGYLW